MGNSSWFKRLIGFPQIFFQLYPSPPERRLYHPLRFRAREYHSGMSVSQNVLMLDFKEYMLVLKIRIKP